MILSGVLTLLDDLKDIFYNAQVFIGDVNIEFEVTE